MIEILCFTSLMYSFSNHQVCFSVLNVILDVLFLDYLFWTISFIFVITLVAVVKRFTTQWRNNSMKKITHKKTHEFSSVISHSESTIVSLFRSFCMSVSVLLIHNHHSVCLHQHPSLFMWVSQSGAQNKEIKREEKTAFQSGAGRRLLSTLFLNDLQDR